MFLYMVVAVRFWLMVSPCLNQVFSLLSSTKALGAAYVAGKALDIWTNSNDEEASPMDTYIPTLTERQRDYRLRKWKDAVQRSIRWSLAGATCRRWLACGKDNPAVAAGYLQSLICM